MRLQKLNEIVSHSRYDSRETQIEQARLTRIEQAYRGVENSKTDWSRKFWKNNLTILLRRAA